MTDLVWLGNSARDWVVAAGVALAVVLAIRIARSVLMRGRRLAEATATSLDDGLFAALDAVRPWFGLAAGAWAGSRLLDVSPSLVPWVERLVLAAILLQAGISAGRWAEVALEGWKRTRFADQPETLSSFNLLRYAVRVAIWSVALLVLLDNLGIDITALVAGLGVGGIAIALAVQNILGDLFASLSILIDKPFLVGDFLAVGDMLGTVEAIGLKTTRLRSLSGEQLVFANTDLLQSRIRNYGRMSERRVLFSFGVIYQTPPDLAGRIPGIVRDTIESCERTRFDRCHFKAFGDSSLVYETVYYMMVPDYNAYMDVQQEINLALLERFDREGIEFAYPTQLLYLHGAEGGASPFQPAMPDERSGAAG
ncbi:MAG: mechanosensitive ion channel family protein [Gemmatimonadota bacterium]|nr:mechanosensitive ion channel family protein [Gemmatimonadota bacterium]